MGVPFSMIHLHQLGATGRGRRELGRGIGFDWLSGRGDRSGGDLDSLERRFGSRLGLFFRFAVETDVMEEPALDAQDAVYDRRCHISDLRRCLGLFFRLAVEADVPEASALNASYVAG